MDIDLFVAAVEAIYAAARDPSLWPDALQAIADVFGDIGTVMVYTRDDGAWGAFGSAGVAAVAAEHQATFKGDDLRARRGVERGVFLSTDAVTDRHVVTDEEIESHPYYQLFAKHGLRWFMGVPVSPSPSINVAISVQRSIDKDRFTDDELALLTRLGRHAEKSLGLSIRLLDAELGNLGMREALSRLRIGVYALDSLGRVVFSNPFGERLIGDGLEIVDRRLRVARTAARESIERRIAETVSGENLAADPKPMLVERLRSPRPLTLYVLPIVAAAASRHDFLTHARAIVLAIEPENDAPPDPAIVRDLLGLTLAEARVAALIGSGMPPRDAALRLGITEETARTALKRVFAKVGVSRQSELAALLTRLVLR